MFPETTCGYQFTIYELSGLMLYSLNLYSDECQLFLSKTGGLGRGMSVIIPREIFKRLGAIIKFH